MFSPEPTLQNSSFAMPYSSRVVALFKDGAQTFLLANGATLTELAGRIDALGVRHQGAPIAIHVQFDYPG